MYTPFFKGERKLVWMCSGVVWGKKKEKKKKEKRAYHVHSYL